MKKILITGGAGFIGSSLAQRILDDNNYQLVLFDNFLTGSYSNIPVSKQITIVEGDVNNLADIKELMTANQFHYVFHYAAIVGVKRTLENPIAVLNDIEGIKNILTYSNKSGVKRVFFSSSSEVYGAPFEFPQKEETTPLNARLPYGIVKNVGEAYCKSFQKEYVQDFTIFRFFNTYGVKQSIDFVIPRFIHAALHDENLIIYGDGSQTRTFCYIDDLVDFTIKALEEERFINEIVNVGCHIQTSILKLAQTIIDISASKSKIVYFPPLKEGDTPARMPDNSKMLKLLNRELTPLKTGIEEILKFKRNSKSQKIEDKEQNTLTLIHTNNHTTY